MRSRMLSATALLASAAVMMGGACSTDGLVFDRLGSGEVCGNDQDDDGDGNTDCADPDCADHQCVRAAPAGWIGPFALYDGDPAAVPACAPPFPVTLLRAYADLQRDDAVCSECSCSPTEESCRPKSINLYSVSACTFPPSTTISLGDDGSVCQGNDTVIVASIQTNDWRYSGTCALTQPQVPVIKQPAWNRAVVGCASPVEGEGGCGVGEVCAPPPAAPFDGSVLCVAHPGEVACTSPIYRSRRLVHAGLADNRWCTACSCPYYPEGSCSGTLRGYEDSSCSVEVLNTPGTSGCVLDTTARYFNWTPGVPSNSSCGASGGDSRGCVRPTDPVAVCCTGNEDPCPPEMVEVPSPGGGSYCVDATEVTNRQYAQFLAADPPVADQPPECAWNQTYVPTNDWLGDPDHPVNYVDWCDAHAYCAWAGKRLCGATSGGATPFDAFDDPAVSQWHAACSRGGEQLYPYGSQYKSNICNDSYLSFPYYDTIIEPVGFRACCEGGYWGLHDMSGNVAEWEDSCDGSLGALDQCRIRGIRGNEGSHCGQGVTSRREGADKEIGIRCCSL